MKALNQITLLVVTTTQRDALTASTGDMVFNSTTSQVEIYGASSWAGMGGGGQEMMVFSAESIGTNAATRSILGTNSQTYIAFSGTGAVDDAGTSFVIPPNYSSGLKFYLIWVMDGTGTGQGRISLNIVQSSDQEAADNATVDESLEILDSGQDTTAWLIQITPKSTSVLTWVAGEVCSLEIERDPGHGSDTMADTFYLKNLIIEYTKS